jgi:multiple sugar transport system ATP-binding protein
VDGRAVTHLDPRERNMAMVFQSYAIYPHLTVRENLAFPLRIAGTPAAEREARIAEAAEALELTELLDRRPATLSGGQRQRVSMGRAMVRNPVAFLLDEPLSNLDARLRGQMRAEIARLHRRLGTTTIYVTHDQTEALTLADRLAVLEGGKVQQVGTPREVYAAPANRFVAGFLGAPPMNFLPGVRDAGEVVLAFGRAPWPGAAGDAPELDVGIRPEDVLEAGGPGPAPAAALRFEARVELIEWLGAETWAHVQPLGREGGGSRLVARLSSETAAREGETVALGIDPARLQYFDSAGGARVQQSAPGLDSETRGAEY